MFKKPKLITGRTMSAQDRPPLGPCAPDGACRCTACVGQAELADTANQLRNLRLYIQQISASRDLEQEEAGAPAERAPAGRAAHVGAVWVGNAGAFPGQQRRAQGAAAAGPVQRLPTGRDAAPATAESTRARVSLGGGAARGTATPGRRTRGEKLRSLFDDDDEQWAVSRDDTQRAGSLSPGRWPGSDVPGSTVRGRTGSISPTPAVPHGCVVSESSMRRGKHSTTARFLQA